MNICLIQFLLTVALTPEQEIQTQAPAAMKILSAWESTNPVPADRRFIITYFTPADREPARDYEARLSRTLLDVRDFYLTEMQRLGFGDRTLRFETEADGEVKIHLVKGKHPKSHYKTESGSEIRKEVVPVLKQAGIDADNETIAIFCYLSDWDPVGLTMSQHSPYYAGGSHRSGTAWQSDCEILDSALLTKTEPVFRDRQYGRITVGKYNSIFVGGVAHEFGHALQLPHDRERPDQQAAFGTALMGSGNRTYGNDRRGEGNRSFLTLASALRLASHPMFSGSKKGFDLRPKATARDVVVVPGVKDFTMTATVGGEPPVYAAVAYMDPAGGSDYDATTATAIPDERGHIVLECDALAAGKAASLRTVLLHANGSISSPRELQFSYEVDESGTPDLSSRVAVQTLGPLIAALGERDAKDVAQQLKTIDRPSTSDALREVARVLAGTMSPRDPGPPSAAVGTSCWLSDRRALTAEVGWGRPVANRIPEDSALLMAAGQIYARGLYAHAPSKYEYDLGGTWTSFKTQAGVADGHGGTVMFVVSGDGKELFRSQVVREGTVIPIELPVTGVRRLSLAVEPGTDGNGSDWGLWLDPRLTRD